MIRVLGLALYGDLAASTRYRLEQYKYPLKKRGIFLEIEYLLDNNYLSSKQLGRRAKKRWIVFNYLKRILNSYKYRKYDLLIIYGEYLPMLPSWIDNLLIRRRYIYDIDDAFYLKYKKFEKGLFKYLFNEKFNNMCRNAKSITAGNTHLLDLVSGLNIRSNYLPTVLNSKEYLNKTFDHKKTKLTLGWIGSYSTARHLEILIKPLEILAKKINFNFIVIGGKSPKIEGVEVIELEWSAEKEKEYLHRIDIGLMPLIEEEWSKGKCGFKLIQYMACGIPVVGTNISANNQIINDDVGFKASCCDDWISAITTLYNNRSLLIKMGIAGKKRVERDFSLNRNLPMLEKIIKDAVKI